MHNTYDDITSQIATQPLWFDEYSVPRYCVFSPKRSVSIYISEIALMEIACQGCGHTFKVAISGMNFGGQSIADAIRSKELHYGDPPNIECCAAGPTMNSIPRRVLQYWRRCHPEYLDRENRVITDLAYFDWRRDPSLEIDLAERD